MELGWRGRGREGEGGRGREREGLNDEGTLAAGPTHQPLDDGDPSGSTLLQLLLHVQPVRVHGPHGAEVLRKLHPQPNGVIIGHVESGLGVIPGPVTLVKRVKRQQAVLPMSVLHMLEGGEGGWEGGGPQGGVVSLQGGGAVCDGEGNKVLDEAHQPGEVLQVATVGWRGGGREGD